MSFVVQDPSTPIVHVSPDTAIIPAFVEITNPSIARTYPEPVGDPGPTSEYIVKPLVPVQQPTQDHD